MSNQVSVIVRPNVFSVVPAFPEVVGGVEPFAVSADWTQNAGTFSRISIQGFRDGNGLLVYANPASADIVGPDTGPVSFDFSTVSDPLYVKYDVVFTFTDPSRPPLRFDPVVVIKPR